MVRQLTTCSILVVRKAVASIARSHHPLNSCSTMSRKLWLGPWLRGLRGTDMTHHDPISQQQLYVRVLYGVCQCRSRLDWSLLFGRAAGCNAYVESPTLCASSEYPAWRLARDSAPRRLILGSAWTTPPETTPTAPHKPSRVVQLESRQQSKRYIPLSSSKRCSHPGIFWGEWYLRISSTLPGSRTSGSRLDAAATVLQ